MDYAILRFEKCKSVRDLQASRDHCTRAVQSLSQKQRQAIAQEMILSAHIILNTVGRNYLRGRNRLVFSRRKGMTKIATRDGKPLVHDQGGTPSLSEQFTLADQQRIRQVRDYVLLAHAQTYAQQEQQRSKKR